MSSEPSPMAPPGPGDRSEGSRAILATLLALTFAMNMIGRGVTETFAVFLLPVQRELGATRPAMTATYSVFMLAYAVCAPFAGQLIDRLGARATYGVGLGALGAGYVLASQVSEIWQYYLTVGLCGGLGAATLGMVSASSLLSRWFTSRMGSVMSMPYAAVGAGMLIVPPVTQLLVDAHGWRTAHLVLGLATLGALPLVMLLPLSTLTRGSPSWRRTRAGMTTARTGIWTVGAALRTSAWWGLFAAYFWTSVAAYSVLPQSVAYLIEQGFNPLVAASAFGMTGMLSVIGILAVGWLSDRFGRRLTVTFTYLVTITGILSLISIAFAPGLLLLYLFVLCFGLMQGARGPILLSMLTVLYPGGAIGSIFGALSVALGLGAGAGSLVSGLLKELTGAYHASFSVAVLSCLLGIAIFWLVPSLYYERVGGRPPAVEPDGREAVDRPLT